MPPKRSPERDKAFEIYKENGGNITNREISIRMDVPEKSVGGWKAKDKWSKQLNGVLQLNKRSTTKKHTEYSKKEKKRKESITVIVEPDIENDELTDKQRIFCLYYVKSFNATQAMIKAGYAHDSAHVEGHRLLRKPKVSEEIKRIKSEMANVIFLDAVDILNKYMAIAFSDISDYVDFGNHEVPIITKKGPVYGLNGEMMMTTESYVSFKNANEVDGTLISEVKEGKEGVSFKLLDKMKAFEILGRYLDLLPDHHKRRIEEERLKIDQERLAMDKDKASGEGDADDELIDDWVGAVLEDGADIEGEEGNESEVPSI